VTLMEEALVRRDVGLKPNGEGALVLAGTNNPQLQHFHASDANRMGLRLVRHLHWCRGPRRLSIAQACFCQPRTCVTTNQPSRMGNSWDRATLRLLLTDASHGLVGRSGDRDISLRFVAQLEQRK